MVNQKEPYLKINNDYNKINNVIKTLINIFEYNNTNNEIGSSNSNWNFWAILLLIIIICIIFYICIYSRSNNDTANIENETQNNMCSYNPPNNINYRNNEISMNDKDYSNQNTDKIHCHLCLLEELIKKIRKSIHPLIAIDICLICNKKIILPKNMQNEINNRKLKPGSFIEMGTIQYENSSDFYSNNSFENEDNINTRFACNHVYHTDCLKANNIAYCMICSDDSNYQQRQNSLTIVPNKLTNQVVTEGDIKKFIQKLKLIYPKDALKQYIQRYPLEYDTFNRTLILGLGSAWGIAAVAGIGLIGEDKYQNTNNIENDIFGQTPVGVEEKYSPEPNIIISKFNINEGNNTLHKSNNSDNNIFSWDSMDSRSSSEIAHEIK